MAKNVTTSNDDQSDSNYNDDFNSTFNKSESHLDGSYSSKLSDSKTFKMQKSGNEPLDEDDMLLQESRHLHQKIKAQRRRESHHSHHVA